MKMTYILILGALISLTSCGMIAQSTSSDNGAWFQDGIYSSSPSFRTKEDKNTSKSRNDSLVAMTKASPIYLFGEKKDTIMIPENFSARIQYDQKVGGTVVTVGENPYDWRWDLENNYGYYYGPYSIGSSWYWSRHYSPFYSSFYSPYYSPYWNSWAFDPWYYGGFYDPWYYGGYWGGYYGGYWGWHDPWHHYHHHCGWYDPYHHHGGPSHIVGGPSGGSSNRYEGLRARTEFTGSVAGSHPSGNKASGSVRTTTGTVRGGMSVGNRTSRASTAAGRNTSSVSRSTSVSRGTASGSSSAPTYRRPSNHGTTSGTSGNNTHNSQSGTSSGSSYNRGSASGSSGYTRSYESSSYNRGTSSSYGGYSRGSGSTGGGSSYSRGSSGGGYRR